LLNWQPEEMAVSVAEANLAAAEANYDQALSQDAVSGNSLTSARVGLDQAQRNLTDVQDAYDQAWQEARDWELNYNEPICFPGQGGGVPCSGPTWKERLEQERDGTTRGLQQANDSLSIARANYALAQAGLSDSPALDAAAAVTNAERTLQQAQTGPKDNEIAAAHLQVEQAKLSLQQAEFNLEQATKTLENAQIHAPWDGIVMSVDVAQAAFVTAGTPIITLFDTGTVQFQTINLSERDLAYIEPGQPAEITFKTYPSQPISGTVAHIVPQASGQIGDAATFTVVVDIEPTDLRLWSGMTGRAEIQRSEE
jgi:multidrug resistance efflux pump